MNKYINIYQDMIKYGLLDSSNKITGSFSEYIVWTELKSQIKKRKIRRDDGLRQEMVLDREIKAGNFDIEKVPFSKWKIKNEDIISRKFNVLFNLKKDGVVEEEDYRKMIAKTKDNIRKEYEESLPSDLDLKQRKLAELKEMEAKWEKYRTETDVLIKKMNNDEEPFYKAINEEEMVAIYKNLA